MFFEISVRFHSLQAKSATQFQYEPGSSLPHLSPICSQKSCRIASPDIVQPHEFTLKFYHTDCGAVLVRLRARQVVKKCPSSVRVECSRPSQGPYTSRSPEPDESSRYFQVAFI